jgi:hypothetical protein
VSQAMGTSSFFSLRAGFFPCVPGSCLQTDDR